MKLFDYSEFRIACELNRSLLELNYGLILLIAIRVRKDD